MWRPGWVTGAWDRRMRRQPGLLARRYLHQTSIRPSHERERDISMLGSAGPPAEPAELQSASSVLHFIGAAGLGRPDDTSRTLRELFHQALLEKAPDVVFTLSPEGVITSLNPAFDRITGWPAVEWIGRTFLALVHPDDH